MVLRTPHDQEVGLLYRLPVFLCHCPILYLLILIPVQLIQFFSQYRHLLTPVPISGYQGNVTLSSDTATTSDRAGYHQVCSNASTHLRGLSGDIIFDPYQYKPAGRCGGQGATLMRCTWMRLPEDLTRVTVTPTLSFVYTL